jgi:predicted dehydrogenase
VSGHAPPAGSPGSPLRLVVVGLGFWGASWLPVVRASPGWDLVAAVDADEHALARATERGNVARDACFESLDAALASVAADAALVVVPPRAHAPVASAALAAGLHCLIEKPFASTLEEARAVVERADEAGRTVMVSQQYRHRPGARTVRQLVGSGAIGSVGAAYVRFCNIPPLGGFQVTMEEPLLNDMAIHHFDLVRAVLGLEPVSVLAAASNPPWSAFSGNAAATAVLETADGAVVSYTGNWAPRGATTGWDGVWDILGDAGSIRWDGDDVRVAPLVRPRAARIRSRLLGRQWDGRRARLVRVVETDRRGSLAEFGRAIREGREPETSGRDNLRSLALVLAAVESSRRRAAVTVDV